MRKTLYRAGPSTAKIGVLAFPDIFGPESGRTKADADRLGELGYAIVVVDATAGDWLEYTADFFNFVPAYLKRVDFGSVIQPVVENAIAYLKQEAQVAMVCSYGYCFGGWVGGRFSAVPANGIQGHVSFHPSWTAQNILHGDGGVEALTRLIITPQLLLAAGNDVDSLREGGSVEKILKSKDGKVGRRILYRSQCDL